MLRYLKPEKKELFDFFIITTIISLLFTVSYFNFDPSNNFSFLQVFFLFWVFVNFVIGMKLLIVKFSAYRHGFEIHLYQTRFDRYGIRDFDKLSSFENMNKFHSKAKNVYNLADERTLHDIKPTHFKGIPTSTISVILYIFSLGLIVFPSIWNYKCKKIPHLFIGTKEKFDTQSHMYPLDVTDYRLGKVLFTGFFSYFVIGVILKVFFSVIGESFYNWFIFILYWIAFFTILPIPGTEGHAFWRRWSFGWISAITILILGMLALLIFDSILYVILVTAFSALIVLWVQFWNRFMK